MKQIRSISFSAVLTALAFTTVLYAACGKDGDKNGILPGGGPCASLNCQNGGSCKEGKCECPLEYEGTECEKKVLDKFIGTWVGQITCSSGPSGNKLIVKPAAVGGIKTVWIRDSIEANLVTADSLDIPRHRYNQTPIDSLQGYIKYSQGKLIYYHLETRWAPQYPNGRMEINKCWSEMTKQ